MKWNIITFSIVLSSISALTAFASTADNPAVEVAGTSADISTDSSETVGKVTKAKGKVFYHKGGSVRSKKVKGKQQELFVQDMLRTKKGAKAFLTLVDNSRLILNENSVINFNGVKKITAEKGIVLFDIKKQGTLKGLQITTKTAVIGIKGTRFIIDASEDSLKLYMKEGLVNVEAINGPFKHHLKDEADYKNYQKDMLDSFSEYMAKQNKEFVEYVKSIDVPANKAISINGNELEDIKIPDYIEEQFKLLDEFDG